MNGRAIPGAYRQFFFFFFFPFSFISLGKLFISAFCEFLPFYSVLFTIL